MRTEISEVPIELQRRVATRLEALRGSALGEPLREAFIGDLACPIYRPDLEDVAYWEFEIMGLKGGGFIVASANRHDLPLPHWSVEVKPPSRALEAQVLEGKVARVVKLDSLAYAAEDADGTHLAQIGQLPPKLPSISASRLEVLTGAQGWLCERLQAAPGGTGQACRRVVGDRGLAAEVRRRHLADAVAPLVQDVGVGNVIRELNGQVRTFNMFGQGATCPWDMPGAWAYLNGRTWTGLRADWNSFGFSQDWLRDRAIDSIVNRRTPAIIGTGWLSHYPLAYGYAWQTRIVRHSFLWWSWDETVTDRCFIVNQGWGSDHIGEWVDASTWFAGQIYP